MNLFDFSGPDSHAHDPETSAAAVREHTASGNRGRHCQMVLALVQRHPGQTACELFELASAADLDSLREVQDVRRRLVDLERNRLVRKGPPRKCSVRKTSQRTWNAT